MQRLVTFAVNNIRYVYFENKDLEIKEVKKGLMHHMKEVTALQKQMTAMVNIVLVFKCLILCYGGV